MDELEISRLRYTRINGFMVLAQRRRELSQLSRRLYATFERPRDAGDGSAFLPQADCVLPRIDKWAFPQPSKDPTDGIRPWRHHSRFTAAVLAKNVSEAWTIFSKFPVAEDSFVRTMMWTGPQAFPRFLRLLQSDHGNDRKPWEQARQVKGAIDTMRTLGHSEFEFAADDYAQLIKLAGRACNFESVQQLWAEATELGIPKNTNMWNQYLAVMCDTDVEKWNQPAKKFVGDKPLAVLRAAREVNAANFVELEAQMIAEGVAFDARTVELKLLAAARLGLVADAQELVVDHWLHPDLKLGGRSPMTPTLSTLRSVFEALAFNNQIEVGFRAAEVLASKYKSIKLGSGDARKFWVRVLRHYRDATEPRGPLASIRFGEIWNKMIEKYKFVPGAGPWSAHVEFLEWKNQFHEMEQCIRPILDTVNGPVGTELASSTLKRAATGLGNTGHIDQSIKILQYWAEQGLDLRREMLRFVRSHAGDREKLGLNELADEDEDDEEGLLGF